MTDNEFVLSGGARQGHVHRVGDTVRRPAGPWTPSVHSLLAFLEGRGFPAPKPLGIDERGREILSFVEGEAATWPFPRFFHEPEAVAQVGQLLRRFHDLVAEFVPPA